MKKVDEPYFEENHSIDVITLVQCEDFLEQCIQNSLHLYSDLDGACEEVLEYIALLDYI